VLDTPAWYAVSVPAPSKARYLEADEALSPAADMPPLVEYEWRKFQLFWDAAPIRLLVERGTSNETAILLYWEHIG
jgi:hypothetical protein